MKFRFALLVALLAGFVLGIVHLFQLRFSAGDIYPPYSSLRADPLGTEVLYESLRRLPGLSVDRFFLQDSKLIGSPKSALFVVGTEGSALEEMSVEDLRALQAYIHEGGRLVICLLPSGLEKVWREEARPRPQTNTNHTNLMARPISFLATNGLALKNQPLPHDDSTNAQAELAVASGLAGSLPSRISWHSGGYFSQTNSQWRVIYELSNRAVMVERSFGAGSVALATDSYFVSNEALRNERHAELLLWLAGGRREILFDETHLGVQQQLGVAVLARKYHLEGSMAALLLLAGLFIWKNSASLLPAQRDELDEGGQAQVMGKESSAGLVSLLRRSVAPKDVLLTGFEQWKSACARQPRIAARLPEIEAVIAQEQARPAAARRPLETYRAIQRILTHRAP